jgi:hypothetical protein
MEKRPYRVISTDAEAHRFIGHTLDPRNEGFSPTDFTDLLYVEKATGAVIESVVLAGEGINEGYGLNFGPGSLLCRARNIHVEAGRKGAICVQGDHVTLSDITITRPGRRYDLVVDNPSQRVRGTRLREVFRADGKAVRVLVVNGDPPEVLESYVEFLFWSALRRKLIGV